MGKFSLTFNEKCFILYICPRDRIPVSQIHFVPIFPRQWKWRQKCPEKKIFLISQVEAKMSRRRNIFLIFTSGGKNNLYKQTKIISGDKMRK